MLFEIVHRTHYRYGQPVREAYIEARLTPPDLPGQSVVSHAIEFSPETPVSTYEDYFGNVVSFYAMTLRHETLSIVNRATIRTHEIPRPADALEVSVAEARQIFSSRLTDSFDYLQPTVAVPTGNPAMEWARKFFPGGVPLGDALDTLNKTIHQKFRYEPGSTDNATPLSVVWKQRTGVCQDFAHLMLSVLRTAGIPARYVCGYIESERARLASENPKLVGWMATHAWVEVLTPGMAWVALDPTNDQWCGPRHVTVSYGRDFEDATPVRGTFKGSGARDLKVKVSMKRLPEKA